MINSVGRCPKPAFLPKPDSAKTSLSRGVKISSQLAMRDPPQLHVCRMFITNRRRCQDDIVVDALTPGQLMPITKELGKPEKGISPTMTQIGKRLRLIVV